MLQQPDAHHLKAAQFPKPQTNTLKCICSNSALQPPTQPLFPPPKPKPKLINTISSTTTSPINTPAPSISNDDSHKYIHKLTLELALEKKKYQDLRSECDQMKEDVVNVVCAFIFITLIYFFGSFVLKLCIRGVLFVWDFVGEGVTRYVEDVLGGGGEGYVERVVKTVERIQYHTVMATVTATATDACTGPWMMYQ